MYLEDDKNPGKFLFFLFLIIFTLVFLKEDVEPFIVHFIYAIIGIIFALVRRKSSQRKSKEESLLKIVLNDYLLTKNASLALTSIIYAIFQGASLFLSLSLMLVGISNIIERGYYSWDNAFANFIGSISVLIGLLLFRLLIELFTSLLRFGENFSQFKEDFRQYSKNRVNN